MSAAVALSDDEDSNELESNDLFDQMPVRNKRKFVDHAGRLDGTVDRFGALTKESDDNMLELEKVRHNLERQRRGDAIREHVEDRKDRAEKKKLKREERKADMQATARLDLENFMMMMETMLSFQKKDCIGRMRHRSR